MLQASEPSDLSPRQRSFAAAMQKIAACSIVLQLLDEEATTKLIDTHLAGLLARRVGDRPNPSNPAPSNDDPSHTNYSPPHAIKSKLK